MSETLSVIDLLFARQLLPESDEDSQNFLANLFHQTRNGHFFVSLDEKRVPEEITLLANKPNSPIVIDGNDCYLQRNYELEKQIASNLFRIAKDRSSTLKKPETPPSLYEMQQKAFEMVFANKLCVITGGPGSGKSYLAKCIIDALLRENPTAKVIATAPTGKAASRLKHPKTTTKTLHSLLRLKQGETATLSKAPIICDLLIIDESSMIDIKLFKLIFESILPHTHVVLMGDPDQLPPIESGAIFGGLQQIEDIPVINLNQTKRTECTSLQALADAVRKSDPTPLIEIAKPLPRSPPILREDKSVILTPYKKGHLGADACNKAHLFYPKRPIMITQNDYKLGLMNGEIGSFEDGKVSFETDEGMKTFPLPLLSHYTYAFAISIHKSQGSEFDHVHLVLPPPKTPYSKQLIYTALTRAKKSLTIYANEETIIESVTNNQPVVSNIAKRYSSFEER